MDDISEFLQSYNETLRQEIADADMPPELTERFTFDSCVKQDEGRAVYFVTQKSDGARAVLRVTDAGCKENAAKEGEILSKLDNPAIPKVLGVWEQDGRGFLVREYFGGDDLKTYVIKHGTLPREQLIDLTLRLCDLLSYIHGQSPAVIHRDIKPENIVLSGKNNLKLIDFGISRDYKPNKTKDEDTRVVGTTAYMAPEQFGSEQTDNRADIFSLGVVMIFLATGEPNKSNLRTAYPYKELVPIIEKCIRKDRAQRFSTAANLKSKILWVKRKTTRKILLAATACLMVAAAFVLGLHFGQIQGFQRGVASIMDVPTDKYSPFTPDELNQPVTFDNWYIDQAVRNALNMKPEDTIYRSDTVTRISDIKIYGTWIIHPALDDVTLNKVYTGKGAVAYTTTDGFKVERGNISSLSDIPNMYYLKNLTLTSQSISDLSPLSGMKLEQLVVCDNYIGNLLPIKDMVTLKTLDVGQNPLNNLAPISRLLSLESLDISETQVTDIKPLSGLIKLQTLNLNYCDISDISVLAKLPNLKTVDLSNTKVTDLSPLVRPDNPVTVRCVGLPESVVDKVRGKAGIVLVEE